MCSLSYLIIYFNIIEVLVLMMKQKQVPQAALLKKFRSTKLAQVQAKKVFKLHMSLYVHNYKGKNIPISYNV